jgi:hypothetical protein
VFKNVELKACEPQQEFAEAFPNSHFDGVFRRLRLRSRTNATPLFVELRLRSFQRLVCFAGHGHRFAENFAKQINLTKQSDWRDAALSAETTKFSRLTRCDLPQLGV